jgi:hypothetical protein
MDRRISPVFHYPLDASPKESTQTGWSSIGNFVINNKMVHKLIRFTRHEVCDDATSNLSGGNTFIKTCAEIKILMILHHVHRRDPPKGVSCGISPEVFDLKSFKLREERKQVLNNPMGDGFVVAGSVPEPRHQPLQQLSSSRGPAWPD